MPDASWGRMVTPMEITEHVTFNIKYEKKHSLVPRPFFDKENIVI